jgi:hypothetical protein
LADKAVGMKHLVKFGCLFLILCSGFVSCKNEVEPIDDLWIQLRNTAWIKEGDQDPSLGFYSPNRGPSDERYKSPDTNKDPYGILIRGGSSSLNPYILKIDRTGRKIIFGNMGYYSDDPERKLVFISSYEFKVSVSVDGNSLTISSGDGYDYEFYGKYTKAPSNQTYSFYEGRDRFWQQIQNTAWTKQEDPAISVGFYEREAGPLSYYGENTSLTQQLLRGFGPWWGEFYYAACKIPLEGGASGYSFKDLSISLDGKSISGFHYSRGENIYTPLNFNIAVNGSTLTISTPEGYDYNNEWYQGNLNFESGIDDHSISVGQFASYFCGTYTKNVNNDFGYDPEVGKKAVLLQILNTAWTKSGNLVPTVGFYEAGKGPISPPIYWSLDYDYFTYVRPEMIDMALGSLSQRELSLDRKGREISPYSNYYDSGLGITVSSDGNTLTITNAEQYFNDEQVAAFFNGIYIKTSSDPDYDWGR